MRAPGLAQQARKQARTQQAEVARGDQAVAHAREHEDAQPLGREDGGQVGAVEALELVGHRQRAVEQGLPGRVPAAHEDGLVDPVDQRPLGGEVVVQQRVGDADLGGQFAGLRIEAAARKKIHRAGQDLLLTLGRAQAPARRRCWRRGRCRGRRRGLRDLAQCLGWGFCGIDHLLNNASIVECLLNRHQSRQTRKAGGARQRYQGRQRAPAGPARYRPRTADEGPRF